MSIVTDPMPEVHSSENEGWLTRPRALTLVLVVATVLAFWLCYLMIEPFISVLAFALALAIVAHPLHDWILFKVKNAEIAAIIAVILVALVIIVPSLFVIQQIVQEAAAGASQVRAQAANGDLLEYLVTIPLVGDTIEWLYEHVNLQAAFRQVAAYLSQNAPQVLAGSLWAIVQLLLVLFTLYFFFRDRGKALRAVRSLLPLSDAETDEVFKRVDDTIYATVYGSLVVAVIQGTMGGLMFWWLGLPMPAMWGAIMALLAVVPNLGTFVIWVPTAIILALSGDYTKAVILAVWGGAAIALIDNLLFPLLVGRRMRLHTLLVFFAIIGGLAWLGMAGVVLGPVILALTLALISVWRKRTADGKTAEEGLPEPEHVIKTG